MIVADSENAGLFIFSYSGFVYTSFGVSKQFMHKLGDLDIIVLPPIRLALPTWRPSPQIDKGNWSKISPNNFNDRLTKLALYPSIVDGKNAITTVISDDNLMEDYKDTFQVIASSHNHSVNIQSAAQRIIDTALSWIRVRTGQWWVGRSGEALYGNMHTTFTAQIANDNVSISDEMHLLASITTPDENFQALSDEIWQECCYKAASSEEPDIIDRLYSDLRYNIACREKEQLILIACSIYEILRDQILEKAGIKKRELKCQNSDLLAHLSRGFKRAMGRSMSEEVPDSYKAIERCWITRGHLAHGKVHYWTNEVEEEFLGEDRNGFWENYRFGIVWLQKLKSEFTGGDC